MKTYQCHKQVEAVKIDKIVGKTLIGVGGEHVDLSNDWLRRWHMTAVSGGYFVRYRDGYESYSPEKEFEDGYSVINTFQD